MYVLKIFFPQEFMMSIQNERTIEIGTFIDSHVWLNYLCSGITSFIVYWLFCCAVSKKLYLNIKETIIIILTVIIIRLVGVFDNNMASILMWTSFMFLTALCKGDLKIGAFVFTTHSILQGLSINIRNLPMYLTSINSIISILMVMECYLWLVLMYIIFNYKKKEN